MSKYDIDFNLTSVELLPTAWRQDDPQNLLYSLVAPLNSLELIFTYLRENSGAAAYSGATTYTYGEMVNYQSRVYFRNDITEDYAAGFPPNNTTYWIKVLDYTIGMNERIRFRPDKLVLEYALNKIFDTTFAQPPTLSDIYIVRNNTQADGFEIGQTEEESSTITQFEADAEWSIPEFEADGTVMYDYTVFVPVAVWTALASTGTERDNIVLSVLNKYKLLGFIADVQTY